MEQALKSFEERPPLIIFEWNDRETEARGWCVINSLRGGAAGGGTRMRKGLDKHEVLSLAKTMEIKFTVAGPSIGGAKSGIDFDPADPRKEGVLRRWYAALLPLLKNYYGTGGDFNVDEIHEVIPYTEQLGLLHPQEGVFNGHYQPEAEQRERGIRNLRQGVLLPVFSPELTQEPGRYTVADLITGYGVAESLRHHAQAYGQNPKDKRVIVQGWGNVGAAAAWYLGKMGARVVGIIDRVGGLLNPNGFSLEELGDLMRNRTSNFLVAPDLIPFEEINRRIWAAGAEWFVPAAASRLVTESQLDQMLAHGLEVISSGANVPFADEAIFYGPISRKADEHCSCIPDFISNCGMARTFAYLMEHRGILDERALFTDISTIIGGAIQAVRKLSSDPVRFTHRAYEIALAQLQ
ncbi:amino acid dehydrogenase [bacterium]|nr:amino acid dehydrogenase [bacterium]